MKLKIEFTFGCEYKGDGQPILAYEKNDGMAEIRAKAVKLFGGCTIIHTEGDWLDPDTKALFSEGGATVAVLTSDTQHHLDERVCDMAQQIKTSLQQKVVAVTRTEVQFDIF